MTVLLRLALANKLATALLVLSGALGLGWALESQKAGREQRLMVAVQRETAIRLSAVEGVAATRAEIIQQSDVKIAQFEREMLAAGAKGIEHTVATAAIVDTAQGRFTPRGPVALAPADCPGVWQDEYNRFRVDLPSGLLHRSQLFGVEGAVLRSSDGKHRFTKLDLREFDPTTKAEIPVTGITINYRFAYADEADPVVPFRLFDWKFVGGLDYRAAIEAGVKTIHTKNDRFALLALASWDRHTVAPQLQLSYRPKLPFLGETNLWLGPSYDPLHRSWGAGIVVEISR